jgi:hypothetical protein
MASKGLARLFQATHRTDSATKYALYSYAMNDSVYTHMATAEVVKMKALYDYTHSERLAYQKEQEADQLRNVLIIVVLSASSFY